MTYWFWWPITVLAVATFTAIHLYGVARASGRSAGNAVALASVSIGALSLLAIPLAVAGHTPCSSEGADVISPNLFVVGVLFIVWAVVLCGLYSVAGAEGVRGLVVPAAAAGATLLGLFLETFVAYLSLDNYCRTGSRNGLYGQLGGAVLAAVVVGTVTVVVMRLRPTYN